jgi:threonine dehydrogenase-like Zn-dependent dehydrogenase
LRSSTGKMSPSWTTTSSTGIAPRARPAAMTSSIRPVMSTPCTGGSSSSGRAGDHRADLVLEATGVTPGLKTAAALVRPFGTLCVVGYHHKGDAMMDMDLWYRGVTTVNGFCPDQRRLMRAMSDALDLIARHRFSYAPLVTHRFGLMEVDRAFELMDARADGFVKAVLEPQAPKADAGSLSASKLSPIQCTVRSQLSSTRSCSWMK